MALGQSLPMIGRLLGHSEVQTTKRYAQLAADWVKESAVRVSESLASDILTGYAGVGIALVQAAPTGVSEELAGKPMTLGIARICARSPRAS